MSVFKQTMLIMGTMFITAVGLYMGSISSCITFGFLAGLAWYYLIKRTKNKIRIIHSWKGQTTGTLTTLHPGGMMTVNGKSIYRESYAEYQFEHEGKTYTSTCVDAILNVSGTKPPNLSKTTTSLINIAGDAIWRYNAKGRGISFNPRDFSDPDDEENALSRDIHDKHTVGDQVTVYYDTEHPENSTLVRRKEVPSYYRGMCNHALTLLALFALTEVFQLIF